MKDGKTEGECVDKPAIRQSASPPIKDKMLKNWALAAIKREERAPLAEIDFVDDEILRSGAYYDFRTGEKVTFSLPAELKAGTPVPVAMSR